ncbi:pantothenate synthetase [Bacillus oleivorans]|uniref:Pantothenate synthetase n=1 Tax=Bacillus oleivorans TaxID=1448271 RepID=A0A285CKU2_9BACI|nr:pantoate--beta-alanine ligase [Bacillus oleivorans]SNX68169.1 pantothenate synthetase [Bacillus oleivorans]
MKIITTIKEMQQEVKQLKNNQLSIGYVPTMGYLHEGHAALIDEARKNNDKVVISIFVNPLQFGPNEDFDAYPRDIDRDERIAKEHGVDFIFYPSVEEMYPRGLSVSLSVTDRTEVLCGKSRPGHFDGVVTVLTKLFHIIQPDRAYFGLKDAQQVAVVDGLITDYHFPLELIPIPTVREEDGLAKSSRNVRLTSSEREEAPQIYKTLLHAQELIKAGERDTISLVERLKEKLANSITGTIDYLEILSYPELRKLELAEGKVIIAVAVFYQKVRLIDNIILEVPRP